MAGCNVIHTLREADVAFVRRDLHAGVEKLLELRFDRRDYRLASMSGVQAADSTCEVDVAIAVYVLEPRILRAGNVYRSRLGNPSGDGGLAALAQSARFRPGNRRSQLDRAHLSTIRWAARS